MHTHAPGRISFIFYLFTFLLSFLVSCAQSTDSTDEGTVERERVEVSGPISEDAVWESGKEYVVTGDVIVEGEATGSHADAPAGWDGKVCA